MPEIELEGVKDMLDLNQLRQRCAHGEGFEYLFFWGHQPAENGRITRSCLSQW